MIGQYFRAGNKKGLMPTVTARVRAEGPRGMVQWKGTR